jgi:two-component system, cell cycle sensor histidine kinase and response regulator CckA
MRIAVIGLSPDELELVSKELGNEVIRVEPGQPIDPSIDFAIAGRACVEANDLRPEVRNEIAIPAIALLDSVAQYETWNGAANALAITDLHRLAFTIKREYQIAARRSLATAVAERERQMRLAQQVAKVSRWDLDVRTWMISTTAEFSKKIGSLDCPCPLSDWLELVHPDDRRRVLEAIQRSARDGVGLDEEFTVSARGRDTIVHALADVISDEDGRPMRIVGMTHDVTDRRRDERALQESEERYRDLASQVPGIVWTMGMDDGLIFLSGQVEALTGYTPQEITAAGPEFWYRIVHPDDLPQLLEELGRARAGQIVEATIEYRIRSKSGEWRCLRDRIRVVEDSRGRRFVGVNVDNTAARAAEDALRASEARYRSLVQQAKDIIFAFDLQGRIVSVDGAFETITGWRADEWIGRPFVEIAEPESAVRGMNRFIEVVRGDVTDYSEYAIRKADGSTITIELTAQAIREGERVTGVVGIARDVTQRKQLEAEQAKAKWLASVGQMATSVAHEFNNVLMGIMPFAELLQRRYRDDARIATATTHIVDAVRRGREVSQEILRFARPAQPVIAPVAIRAWLASMGEKARAMLGPSYEVIADAGAISEASAMLADAAVSEEMIANLIGNARDAMAGSGRLTLRARTVPHADAVVIEVSDTGAGIPPERIPLIFEPIFTTKRTGSGLGLALAQQAMQGQGGTIEVRSEVGKGTTFILTFPCSPMSAQPPTARV